MFDKNTREVSEQGFASIVVALILIIVMALLTVGFSQLARREQQGALTKQLSNQAYYAAETGTNDAMSYLKTHPNFMSTSCLDSLPNNQIGPTGNGVAYTCVLVKSSVPSLVYDNVAEGEARTATFTTSPSLSTLTIAWDSHNRLHTGLAAGGFSPHSSWGSPPVLQFNITPLGNNNFDRTSLINGSFTSYLYPGSGGGSTSYSVGPANQGQIINGSCVVANKPECKVTINGIIGGPYYMIHFLNYYDVGDVTITGTDSANNPVNFIGAQVQVDSTGKAKNVLKRLQVRLPINASGDTPNYALQAQNMCKRMQTAPSYSYTDPGGQQHSLGSTSFDTANPSCAISN